MNHPLFINSRRISVIRCALSTLLCAVALIAFSDASRAQSLGNPVVSDFYQNTAAGTSALAANVGVDPDGSHPGADCPNQPPTNCSGVFNTAVGWSALAANTTGDNNTAVGTTAMWRNTSGYYNSSLGYGSLSSNTTGYSNTAIGHDTLEYNVSGFQNTAVGTYALQANGGNNNTGVGYQALGTTTNTNANTAVGAFALVTNYNGEYNTAEGAFALLSNTTGGNNTAVGAAALFANTSGVSNTGVGESALDSNTTGANNTAFGASALFSNTSGKGNAAQGVNALYSNSTGIRNLGIGSNALYNSNGSYNIALGFDAGYNVTTGSNNIEIGTQGTASDNNTIQIGVQGTQTATTIAGIYGAQITGSAVYVTSTGQLGVQGSSERFKKDIAPMPELSAKLQQLRPVTFHYKTDPRNVTQYGLIAEEVAKVYPELVIRDDSGKIMGVRYEELAPMLLSEVQRQQRVNSAQAAEIVSLKQRERQYATRAELEDLQRQLQAARGKLSADDDRLARR
jgi:hypothetical protein